MIRSFEVQGLNGKSDHKLRFHEDLNILTGRNGSGKTTLLKLLWYSLSGNLERIHSEINFDAAQLETSSFRLSIKATYGNARSPHFLFVRDGTEIDSEEGDVGLGGLLTGGRTPLSNIVDAIHDSPELSVFFPTFRRIEGGYKQQEKRWPFPISNAPPIQAALSEFAKQLDSENHQFISSVSTDDVTALLTSKFADLYEQTNKLHISLSQEITKTIRSWQNSQKVDAAENLRNAETTLNGIRGKIEKNDATRSEIQRPVVVLVKLVMSILRHKGIQITDTITFGEAKEAIASDKLSAGEKQMLSFLCYNAFSSNTSIFIDEPEISMHVDWQRTLFPTLLEQSSTNQFIIATHSPFIYGKYSDKELPLSVDKGE